MKIAFTTLGCPDWTLDKIAAYAHQLAYDGIELRFIAGNIDLLSAPELTTQRAQTLAALRAQKLEICCLDSSVRFDDPSSATRFAHAEDGRRHIELAKALGVPFVRVFGDSLSKAETPSQAIGWVVDGLQRLAEHAQDTGVTVLLESHGEFSRAAVLTEVMERVAAAEVGVLWDVHHPWRFHGESPQQTAAAIGRWVRHVHWKDSVLDPAESSGYRYVLFGTGELPAREFMTALRSLNYAGWHSFEWEKKWHPSIEEPELAFPNFISAMRALLAE